MTPEDISKYATLSDPQMHPDGSRVVFVASRANLEDDRYDSGLWLWDGESSKPFTSGRGDSRPRWSPDGRSLLFLRKADDDDASPQVAIMAANGGEARVVTDFGLGVSEAEWSPDGTKLAMVATEWADGWSHIDATERKRRPRRMTGPEWRWDARGFLNDRQPAVYVSPADGQDPLVVSPPAWRPSGLAWRPDGQSVAVLAAAHSRAGFDGLTQAWEIDIESSTIEPLVDIGEWSGVSYRPDGVVHLLGAPGSVAKPANASLYRLDGDELVLLAPSLDRDIMSPASGPQWLESGSCLVLAEDRGRQVVVELKPDLTYEVTYSQQNYVTDLSTTSATTALAVVLASVTDPGELVLIDDGETRTVSHVNEGFRSSVDLRDCEHFVFDRDGIEFDVWVYLPAGDGPAPVVFNIHGGPATQYGWSFFDEFQVELGAGYAVVATNPRSASGHGEDFVRGALKDWGSDKPVDAVDLLTALDHALARFDRLDRDRVGVMGGSYGGLIITKILSFDHRFKSAIPERGLYNWVSFAGVSDIGLWFGDIYVGDRDYSDWSELWKVSSLRTAHKIRTPCLVIHSESDFRCPIDQGEQLFSTLLANGVTTEFLRFPGESHELSRSGAPRHRVERFDAVLEWHDRFLG